MADCDDTLRELHPYLNDELSTDAKLAIHSHLDGCLDCLQAYDFHAELKLVIREKCTNDEIPAGLIARIERCLNEDFDGDGKIG